MGRVQQNEVERLRAEVSVERLAQARGLTLIPAGAEMVGACPFHPDDEAAPSLVIDRGTNRWRCEGGCETEGSAIEWVMRAEGVSHRHAVELLRALPPEVGTGTAPKRSTVRKLAPPVEAAAADAELVGQVVGYYHETLKTSPEALAYLQSRALAHPELVERHRLGFANRTLGYRLPAKSRVEGAELRGRLQRVGILRPSGHEHFAGSLVVPVLDAAGTIVQLYGRKVTRNLRRGTPTHLWLPGPGGGLWNAVALSATDEVIACRSLIDALTFWAAGYRQVVAPAGPEGFGDDHLDAFARHHVARVLIAARRDPTGEAATAALAARLLGAGIECFRVVFPHGDDANDVARAATDATAALGRMLRAAVWLGKGVAPAPPALVPAAPSPGAVDDAPRRRRPASGRPRPSRPDDAPVVPLLPVSGAEPLVDEAVVALRPPPPSPEPTAEVVGEEVRVGFGERRWRVRGLGRNTSFDLLRVNLLVARDDDRGGQVFHVDTLDLYSARARAVFVKQAADELGVAEEVVRRDVGRVLLTCEGLVDEMIRVAQAPAETAVALSPADEDAALDLLRDPRLVERVLVDFDTLGVVGEETNKLVAYLAAVSRKLEEPLAVMVRSLSGAGKSSLLDAVLALVPEEDRVSFSAMTGQSLYYLGDRALAHKVLAIAEEEGAARVSYALKLLQSEGELSIASTGKDTATGRLVTHTYRVAGPVAILTTTTATDVDEELLNRCLVLTVDEDRDQTRAIHVRQRHDQTLDGLLARAARDEVMALHRNAQRLLRPVLVVNPYAPALTFADERTRTRRDHMKYLTLIRAIALLHQHQRPRRTLTHAGRELSYIEVTPADVVLANRVAAEVLGRSLDELAPQTRRLLITLDELVGAWAIDAGIDRDQLRFTRRDVRESCGWGDTALKVHLARLVELELVLVHRGGRGQSFVYELSWDGSGRDGRPFLTGLIDPTHLPAEGAYDGERSEPPRARSGAGQAPVGGRSALGHTPPATANGQASTHAEAPPTPPESQHAVPGSPVESEIAP